MEMKFLVVFFMDFEIYLSESCGPWWLSSGKLSWLITERSILAASKLFSREPAVLKFDSTLRKRKEEKETFAELL